MKGRLLKELGSLWIYNSQNYPLFIFNLFIFKAPQTYHVSLDQQTEVVAGNTAIMWLGEAAENANGFTWYYKVMAVTTEGACKIGWVHHSYALEFREIG